MRKGLIVVIAFALLLGFGCCKKYEMALADIDKSVVTVQVSLVQTMEMANKAGKAAGEKDPLYDEKDMAARLRTCWEMRALIWTTLLGEKVEYDMEKGDLFYMNGEKREVVKGE